MEGIKKKFSNYNYKLRFCLNSLQNCRGFIPKDLGLLPGLHFFYEDNHFIEQAFSLQKKGQGKI